MALNLSTIGSGLGTYFGGGAGGALGGAIGGIGDGLFGGDEGHSASWYYEKNLQSQYRAANRLPYEQVQGMKTAGLNPILVATKGPPQGASAGAVHYSPADDRTVSVQRQQANASSALAVSTAANQAAQAELYKAQADKINNADVPNVQADTENKRALTPQIEQQTRLAAEQTLNTGSMTMLNNALYRAKHWETKRAITQYYLENFKAELDQKNLPERQKAEISKIAAEARTANTEADLNEKMRDLERYLGAAGNLISTARAVFGKR